MATDASRVAWLWTYQQVCTQDNVAGGTLHCKITPATGQVMRPVVGSMLASGTRAQIAGVRTVTGDGLIAYVSILGASAASMATWPISPAAVNTTAGAVDVRLLSLGPDAYFYAQVTTAAQTETATITVIMLLSTSTQPTVSWAGSGGTPNAAAAAVNSIKAVITFP